MTGRTELRGHAKCFLEEQVNIRQLLQEVLGNECQINDVPMDNGVTEFTASFPGQGMYAAYKIDDLCNRFYSVSAGPINVTANIRFV